MKLVPRICFFLVLTVWSGQAADESIDRLIKKLPAPQKFVDPAANDPLAKQIDPAIKAHNYGVALDLARRLAKRYPKSLNAQMVHGLLAISVRQFREASDAYNAAISIRPDLAAGYIGLGVTNIVQNKFSDAFSNFQRVTRIAPEADIGWIGLSLCAERMGRKGDSLEFARRATVVAPSSVGAWLQAAREEGLAGNAQVAKADLARAKELSRRNSRAKR